MMDKFQIKIPCAKNRLILKREIFCFFKIICRKRFRDFARERTRKSNQTFSVCCEKFLVNARLVIKSFQKSGSRNGKQVSVSSFIESKNRKSIRPIVEPWALIRHAILRNKCI